MDIFLLQGIFHASARAVTLRWLQVIRDKDAFIKQQTSKAGIPLPLHTQNCTESTVLMASVIQGSWTDSSGECMRGLLSAGRCFTLRKRG